MGWGELSGLRRGSRIHFVLTWTLCVLALLLTAATLLPGPNRVPFAAVGVVFVAVFPVVIAALLRAMFSEGGQTLLGSANGGRMLLFVRSLPTGLKWSYAVVLGVLLLALTTGEARRRTPRPTGAVATTTPGGTTRSCAASGSRSRRTSTTRPPRHRPGSSPPEP